MNYREEYLRWLSSDVVDNDTKEELKAIENDEKELEFRFFKYLEFGTGGLRGTMNAGTNAMNVYTVAHASQGLANLIIDENGIIEKVMEKVKPDTNAAEILDYVRTK